MTDKGLMSAEDGVSMALSALEAISAAKLAAGVANEDENREGDNIGDETVLIVTQGGQLTESVEFEEATNEERPRAEPEKKKEAAVNQTDLAKMAKSMLSVIQYFPEIPIPFRHDQSFQELSPAQVIRVCEEKEELIKLKKSLSFKLNGERDKVKRLTEAEKNWALEKEEMVKSFQVLVQRNEELHRRSDSYDAFIKKTEENDAQSKEKERRDYEAISSLQAANGSLQKYLMDAKDEHHNSLLENKKKHQDEMRGKDQEMTCLKERMKDLEKENRSLDEENNRILDCQKEEEEERKQQVRKAVELEKQIHLKKEVKWKAEIEDLKKERDLLSDANEELTRRVNSLEGEKEFLEKRAFFKRKRESLGSNGANGAGVDPSNQDDQNESALKKQKQQELNTE